MTRYDPADPDQQEMLRRLAAGAHAAGNASVAANPSDPAFWMLLDGKTTSPVVHLDGCYICEDPEFAQMGLPLCRACPECIRRNVCPVCNGRGSTPDGVACHDCLATGFTGSIGHVAADEVACDECGGEDGPHNYDEEGLITGLPREQAIAAWNVTHPRSPRES